LRSRISNVWNLAETGEEVRDIDNIVETQAPRVSPYGPASGSPKLPAILPDKAGTNGRFRTALKIDGDESVNVHPAHLIAAKVI